MKVAAASKAKSEAPTKQTMVLTIEAAATRGSVLGTPFTAGLVRTRVWVPEGALDALCFALATMAVASSFLGYV